MAKYDVSPEELQQAKAGVESLLVMRVRLLKKKGRAEDATSVKNEAM